MKNLKILHKLFIYKKVKFSMDSFENIFEYQLSETKEMLKMWFLVGGETTWKKIK